LTISPRERLAREEGTVVKDWGGRLPIALVYPNSYYIGMSNLGLHTLYSQLNRYGDIVCERVFWEGKTQERNIPPLSLESGRPLSAFKVVAFTISYELDYFNVVSLLKASGIPLLAADRDDSHPLVIAGGPCVTANPMPLSPFFDGFGIGEAEKLLPGLLPAIIDNAVEKRGELLKALAGLPGMYVPLLPPTAPVIRQWAKNLDQFPVSSAILTRDTELGELYLIEVERGCPWRCRFCLVSTAFTPMRFRSVDTLLNQAKEGLNYRKRLGLVGPAVSDYPYLKELLSGLHKIGAQFAISSMRAGKHTEEVLARIAAGGARTIALAPEAGSERLRQMINKNIGEDDITSTVDRLGRLGIKQLKLYFMLGLPAETDEDIAGIVRLTLECKRLLDRQTKGARLSLNIAPFVPKASTPFQRLPMAPVETVKSRVARLKDRLAPEGIQLKCESPAWSEVQTVLARGDTGVARALNIIEESSLAGWRKAVAECQLDADFYAHREWAGNQRLPWAIIDTGTG
jgi:radical SAM superfamily enzyme YgiQ (UPF0313 family)